MLISIEFILSLSPEIAENFKEQGNDYYKGKRYREALGFYTQGIDAKPDDQRLQEALLCNRAACNLELREWEPRFGSQLVFDFDFLI